MLGLLVGTEARPQDSSLADEIEEPAESEPLIMVGEDLPEYDALMLSDDFDDILEEPLIEDKQGEPLPEDITEALYDGN